MERTFSFIGFPIVDRNNTQNNLAEISSTARKFSTAIWFCKEVAACRESRFQS
jgi:hypothetical protein